MAEKKEVSAQDKARKAKIAAHKEVTIIAVENKKSTMIVGDEYVVSKVLADVLVKAKRAKLA